MPLLCNDEKYMEEQFRFYLGTPPKVSFSIPGSAMLQKEALELYLNILGAKLDAPVPAVVLASQFTKYYSRILCGVFYTMSRLHLAVNAGLDNITLAVTETGEPCVIVNPSDTVPEPKSLEERAKWRDRITQNLFAGNLQPLIHAICNYFHMSPLILWENCAIYIHHFYKEWLNEERCEAGKASLEDDYRYLIHDAGADRFGICLENPLRIEGSIIPYPAREGHTFRIRKTCCLRYHLSDKASCSSCPLLSEEERKNKLSGTK